MIPICVLSGIVIVQGIAHYIERRDLYNRIMCKDINEYNRASGTGNVRNPTPKSKKILSKWRESDRE